MCFQKLKLPQVKQKKKENNGHEKHNQIPQ